VIDLGHELKRKLAQQFDVFFSDSRIARLALPHLGKEFFSRRRVPFVIKLDRLKKVRQEIDLVLRTVQFIVSGKGNNVTVHFGNTQMSEQELIDNFKVKNLNKSALEFLQNFQIYPIFSV
jgi:ribosome biogenesis protein UTP30